MRAGIKDAENANKERLWAASVELAMRREFMRLECAHSFQGDRVTCRRIIEFLIETRAEFACEQFVAY